MGREVQLSGGYNIPWDAGRSGWTQHKHALDCRGDQGQMHPVSITRPPKKCR